MGRRKKIVDHRDPFENIDDGPPDEDEFFDNVDEELESDDDLDEDDNDEEDGEYADLDF